MAKKVIDVFAVVAWTANDVKTLRPRWSIKRCEEWLGQNERRIRDRLIELGWDVIDTLLPPK